VLAARHEWGQLTGPVHADHELYGERSDAFVEWYVLERCGADGLTPIDRLLRQGPGTFSEADRPAVVAAYHRAAGGFEEPHVEQRLVATWRYDPLWAVWARRNGPSLS